MASRCCALSSAHLQLPAQHPVFGFELFRLAALPVLPDGRLRAQVLQL